MPVHRRVKRPPPMQLTSRDRQLVQAVYEHRLLRQDQIQRLFFPSRNTANRRLQFLYQHGFLQRLALPIRLGEGRPQAVYALDARGADLIAARLGIDRGELHWQKAGAQASFYFLEHTLAINDFRIAITQAAQRRGHRIVRWIDEREVKALQMRVPAPATDKHRRHLPVVPDSYFEYEAGSKRSGFFLEMDMGTMATKRFRDKVKAFLIYKRDGFYQRQFGIHSLRVLTVAPSPRRLRSLKRATEQAQGRALFWFTTQHAVEADQLLQPAWQVAGTDAASRLFEPEQPPAG